MARKAISAAMKHFLRLLEISERVCKESKFVRGADKKRNLSWIRQYQSIAREQTLNAKSVSMLQGQVLMVWNAGVGPDTEEFWRQIRKARLPIKRTHDVVAETLARGRVKDIGEYASLDDNFEALQKSGKIDEKEARALQEMLDTFAAAPRNKQYFSGLEAPSLDEEPTLLPVPVGRLVRLSAEMHRYDYAGMEQSTYLQERGYQGGGESWAGITLGLLDLHQTELIDVVRMDPEGDCLAIWCDDPGPLQAIAKLIARAIKDRRLLDRAIKRAETRFAIE